MLDFLTSRPLKWLPSIFIALLVATNLVTGYMSITGGFVPATIPSPAPTVDTGSDLAAVQHRLDWLEERVHDDPGRRTGDDHWASRLVRYCEVALVLLGLVAAWFWVGRPVLHHTLGKAGARHPQPYDMA